MSFRTSTKCEIYQVTCVVNGKIYIGMSSQTTQLRWRSHLKEAKLGRRQYALYRAIRKYGSASFEVRHIATSFSWDDACELEKILIRERNSLCPNGYNVTTGGDGIPGIEITEDTRRKIGDASRGRKPSDETRQKLSAWQQGRKMKPEWVAKSVAAQQGTKKIYSEEGLAKRRGMLRIRNTSDWMREKLRKAGTGKRHSQKTKDKISKARRLRTLKGAPSIPTD